MHILITGATGFLGQKIVKHLAALGHTVHILGRDTEQLRHMAQQFSVAYTTYDITKDSPHHIILPHTIDRVLHLAWGRLNQYNDILHSTIYPSKHLKFLNILRDKGIKDFTILGTSLEYGLQEGELSENMHCTPVTEYGKGKLALYQNFSKICSHEKLCLRWLRPFYMYADDQAEKTLWGQLLQAHNTQAKEFNMSQGDQLRDYLHADTVAHMITQVSLQNDVQGIMNIGSGQGIPVIALVRKFMQEHHATFTLRRGFYPYPTYEPFAFWANVEKLNSLSI